MRTRFSLFVFFATVSLPLIAMAQTASYNYAEGVDFTHYETYEWVNIAGAGATDQALDRAIKHAIDSQLAAKGLVKSKGAQLCVAYQLSFPREKEIRPTPTDMRVTGLAGAMVIAMVTVTSAPQCQRRRARRFSSDISCWIFTTPRTRT